MTGYRAWFPAALVALSCSGGPSGAGDKAAGCEPSPEVCDGLDNDCDGEVDEGPPADAPTWYADADGDGYGSPHYVRTACEPPTGYVGDASDCDDGDAAINPAGTESCNGGDDDCDGDVDEADAVDAAAWYPDGDGDGWGGAGAAVEACTPPDGYGAEGTDCDDSDPSVNPGMAEVCGDGIDNNCDGSGNGCALEGRYDLADDADVHFVPESDHTFFGIVLTGADDMDGDGLPEVAVSAGTAPHDGTVRGAVYVFSPPFGAYEYAATADAKLLLETPTWGGAVVAPAGDVNRDGYADLLIGASDDQSAYIVFGPVSGVLDDLGSADVVMRNDVTFRNEFGCAVGQAGDVDGDGYGDVLIGDISYDPTPSDGEVGYGAAYLFLGPLSGDKDAQEAYLRVAGETYEAALGERLSVRAGDIDGNGLDDLLLSAHRPAVGSPGVTYVFYSPVSPDLEASDSDARLLGDGSHWISIVNDSNGDGYADVIIGIPTEASDAGASYLVLGPVSGDRSLDTADFKLVGEAGSLAGVVSAAGDVDGDGLGDLRVGAPGYDEGDAGTNGATYLVYGPATGTMAAADAPAVFVGSESSWSGTGGEVGDIDGDGFDDLLIGAYNDLTYEYQGGAVYIFLGGAI